MAGYGSRARRKHMHRHATKRSVRQAPSAVPGDEGSAHVSQSSEDDMSTHDSALAAHANEPSAAASTVYAEGVLPSAMESNEPTPTGMPQQQGMADATEKSKDQQDSAEVASDASHSSGKPLAGDKQHQSAAPKTSATDLGRGGHFWHGERYSSLLSQRKNA